MTKKTIIELAHEPGASFSSLESQYYKLRGVGPTYRVTLGRNYDLPSQAIEKGDFNIKHLQTGETINNERARQNLIKNLVTDIKK